MAIYQLPLTVIFITELVIPLADGEIHRTTLKTGAPNRFSQDVASETRSAMSDPAAERTFYEVLFFSLGGAVLVGLSGIFPLLVIPIEAGPALKHGGKCWKTSRIISNYLCWSSCNLANSCLILLPTLNKLSPTVRFILLVSGNVQILILFTIYTFMFVRVHIEMLQKLIILNSIWEPLNSYYFNKWRRVVYLVPAKLQTDKNVLKPTLY